MRSRSRSTKPTRSDSDRRIPEIFCKESFLFSLQTLIKAMERGHQTYLEKQEASAHLASYLPKDLLGLYLAYM